MENFIENIQEAIYELMSQNCYRENITVAFSPLTEREIIKELYTNGYVVANQNPKGFDKLEGCEVFREHPNNNEIVVYDRTDWGRQIKKIITWK